VYEIDFNKEAQRWPVAAFHQVPYEAVACCIQYRIGYQKKPTGRQNIGPILGGILQKTHRSHGNKLSTSER